MSIPGQSPIDRRVVTSHDGPQHCTAKRLPDGNTAAVDCPYTGRGEEFSPTNMVEAALGGFSPKRLYLAINWTTQANPSIPLSAAA